MPTLEDEQTNIDYSEDISALRLDISYMRTLLEEQILLEKPDYYKKMEDIQLIFESVRDELLKQNEPKEQVATVVQLDETTQKMLDEMRIHTQNSENWLIATCIGVGLIFGIICTLILSNFVRH